MQPTRSVDGWNSYDSSETGLVGYLGCAILDRLGAAHKKDTATTLTPSDLSAADANGVE